MRAAQEEVRGVRAALILGLLALAGGALPTSAPATDCPYPRSQWRPGDGVIDVSCARDGAPLEGAARLLFDLRLDINRVDELTLAVLPGIGPGKASAWVDARRERSFCAVPELERVPGIGPILLARIRPHVAVFAPQSAHCAGFTGRE